MDIQIRHANSRDGRAVTALTRAALQDMESVGGQEARQDDGFWLTYAEKIIESIPKDDRLYLLAQTDHRIVGFLRGKIVKPHEVFVEKKIFHIGILYVTAEARDRGIATALVQDALKWAREHGCREADLNVLFDNEKARHLYRKLGFNVFQYQLRTKLPADA